MYSYYLQTLSDVGEWNNCVLEKATMAFSETMRSGKLQIQPAQSSFRRYAKPIPSFSRWNGCGYSSFCYGTYSALFEYNEIMNLRFAWNIMCMW